MKRLIVLAALAALAAAPAAIAASPAAIDCDAYVVDQAGVFKGDMRSQAEEAANDLQNIGADPRVVFIDTFEPLGSVDDFEEQMVKRCDSWQSADQLRKNNLVALIVAIDDRKAVLSWGERWEPSLEGEADRIRADFLNPYLADSEFGEAVQETFGEVESLLDEQLHPTDDPDTTIINEAPDEPTDLTALWIILAALGGFGLLGLAGFGAVRYRRFLIQKDAAQDRAVAARDQAVNAISEMNQAHDELTRSVEIAGLALGEEELMELNQSYQAATAAVGMATDAFAEMHGEADDPEEGHRIDEYEALAAEYESIRAKAAEATNAISAANALAAELGKLAAELPKRLSALADSLKSSEAVRQEAKAAGYRVDYADSLVEDATKLEKKAATSVTDKRLRDAEESLAAAEALVAECAAWCKALPDLKADLERDAAALALRSSEVQKRIIEVKAVFDGLAATYAEDSWEAVRGNGSEAEAALDYAQKAHVEATRAGSMEAQEWKESRAALVAGNEALDQADTVLKAIVDLRDRLKEAEAAAGNEIELAGADIAGAWEFIRANDQDVPEALEAELKAAEEALTEARRELSEDKPNYLEVVRFARQANETADQVLVDARSSHEQIERLKSKSQSALREAERAVQTAANYIASHSSDVGSAPESQLSSARSTLAEAAAASVQIRSEETADQDQIESLERKVRLAEDAEQEADAAYAAAQRDVREAEEEREEERRRRQRAADAAAAAAAASAASYSSSSSSFGSSGGGGFSSGGFGGGGGGSSSGGW